MPSPPTPSIASEPSRSNPSHIATRDQVAQLSARNNVVFEHSPQRSFHITSQSEITLNELRRAVRSLLPRSQARSWKKVPIFVDVPVSSSSSPVIIPASCSAMTEDGMLKVYPTSGPALTFRNPQRTSEYSCRPALGLIDVYRHTLVPSRTAPRSDWFIPSITSKWDCQVTAVDGELSDLLISQWKVLIDQVEHQVVLPVPAEEEFFDMVRRQEVEEVLAELSEGFWSRLQSASTSAQDGKSLLERLEADGWVVSESYQQARPPTPTRPGPADDSWS